ncbi:MAG: AAA family ATPase [Lachnospiraceae bacterium]|nr:AAA family ATPase [Lachnospiraceae bacterium]
MGIFSPKNSDPTRELYDRIAETLDRYRDEKTRALYRMVTEYYNHPERSVIKPVALFLEVVDTIMNNQISFNRANWLDAVKYGELIYPHMFMLEEDTQDFDALAKVYISMFGPYNVVYARMFIPKLFHLFTDKINYCRWILSIEDKDGLTSTRRGVISEFAIKIRSFCMDEDVFTASLIRLTSRILEGEDPKAAAEREYATLRRMSGVYNVSEERILLAEQKIDAVQAATTKLQDSLKLSEDRAEMLNGLSERITKDVKTFCDDEVSNVKATLSSLREDIKRIHTEFTESQRRSVLAEKDELVNSIISESQNGLRELKGQADTIIKDARRDLLRLNRESTETVNRVENYVKNNERIKDILADDTFSQQLNDKIDKLMEMYESRMAAGEMPMPVVAAPTQGTGRTVIVERPAAPAGEGRPYAPAEGPAGQPPMPPEGRPPMPPEGTDMPVPPVILHNWMNEANYEPSVLLDENIAFDERYRIAMKRKQDMMNHGVHFHAMFDDVLIAVMENANPYLIGPSGCGKTFMVQQIAQILDVESVDIGYINEEYDILGFQTANGGYSCPNFYRCYKYGKIAFCDELDNGNSRATVKLNSFLSDTTNGAYDFPHGERVMRHPNFRIIAAGNTTGNGADANYNTREKIEESVQQRFTPVFVGYDNEVEKSILGDYTDWYRFVVAFRDATTAWSKLSRAAAPGIITTRDVTRIRKYLDHNSFPDEKIIEYEFVQTKDPEYLAFLAKELSREYGKKDADPGCIELIRVFVQRASDIVEGRDISRLF